MKVTVENKKGLEKNIKILIDKKTISEELDSKYQEIKKDVVLKGFRPGKVPTEILKRQFGKAVYGEVIDKVLKETSAKALEDNKIKPAGQPKIDLKSFGEGKDLEYVISVTELPKIDIKPFENLKFEDYSVKIDKKETDKRIEQIAKTQQNFKDVTNEYKAKKGDLVNFDYEATVDGKDFKGSTGKNTQLVLGKDLFIKGFDEQLIGVKKSEDKKVNVKLPENFNVKELINKDAIFNCKILNVKEPIKIPSAAKGTITLRILKSNSFLNRYTAIISENIRIGRMIASACCNGITTVIKGTDINDIEPPKPDLAIP